MNSKLDAVWALKTLVHCLKKGPFLKTEGVRTQAEMRGKSGQADIKLEAKTSTGTCALL
jgi:hypothetical protein